MAPRLALLKAALCLAALHAHCATAYATENCVVCGADEATRCKCSGCDGTYFVNRLVTVDCSNANIVSLAPQPLNDTLPEGTGRLCVEWLDSASTCLRMPPPLHAPAAHTHTPHYCQISSPNFKYKIHIRQKVSVSCNITIKHDRVCVVDRISIDFELL